MAPIMFLPLKYYIQPDFPWKILNVIPWDVSFRKMYGSKLLQFVTWVLNYFVQQAMLRCPLAASNDRTANVMPEHSFT